VIKSVVFDLDDTLYKEQDFVMEGFKAVSNYLGGKYNLSKQSILNECHTILETQGRGHIFDSVCKKYGIVDENISNLVEVYRRCTPRLKFYEDAEYILKKLMGKFKLGLITDGKSSVQWNKIQALNLKKYMDCIIVTDDYGKQYWKPNERAYTDIIKKFNCIPSECVYIGDNPNKDFIGARKLGFNTIRIIRDYGDHMNTFLDKNYEADYNINNLKELVHMINKF